MKRCLLMWKYASRFTLNSTATVYKHLLMLHHILDLTTRHPRRSRIAALRISPQSPTSSPLNPNNGKLLCPPLLSCFPSLRHEIEKLLTPVVVWTIFNTINKHLMTPVVAWNIFSQFWHVKCCRRQLLGVEGSWAACRALKESHEVARISSY